MYRSYWRILGNVLAVIPGSLFFGYSLAYISMIPTVEIMHSFKIPQLSSDRELTIILVNSLLAGMIPLGALFGALLSSIFNKRLTRR